MIINLSLIAILLIKKLTIVEMAFPNSLKGFGYAFNEEGELRKIDSITGKPGNEPFEFKVSLNRSYNQQYYEAVGEVVTDHVYKLLETICGLQRWSVPRFAPPAESSFIFASPDALTNPEKLLILIHGSGVVRAGQWARSLIINEGLKNGTQIPAILRARELGYAVLVLNTNDNREHLLPGSENPEAHATTVWQSYVRAAAAKHIAILAHSYGGMCTLCLATTFLSDFRERVFAVAFTDSAHYCRVYDDVNQLLREIGRNWVTSDKPLDTLITSSMYHSLDIIQVSAGHTEHSATTHSSLESVFKFIEERYLITLSSVALSKTVEDNEEPRDAENSPSHSDTLGENTCNIEVDNEDPRDKVISPSHADALGENMHQTDIAKEESCDKPEPVGKDEVMEYHNEGNEQGPDNEDPTIGEDVGKKPEEKTDLPPNSCDLL